MLYLSYVMNLRLMSKQFPLEEIYCRQTSFRVDPNPF